MNYVSHLLSAFVPYIKNDIIVQTDGDSGDSAQRTASFFALSGMAKIDPLTVNMYSNLEYENSIKQHEVTPGIYRRSNDMNHWGHNPNNFSRDQWSIMQLAFAVNGDKKRLLESMSMLLSHRLFHQNTHEGTDGNKPKTPDLAHPSHFSVFIRGMNWWILWPLLCLIDLLLVGDLICRKYFDSAKDYDNQFAQQLLYANIKLKTPISSIVLYMYKNTDFIAKLDAYHSVTRNGIPCFPALFWLAYTKNQIDIKEN